MMLTKRAMQPMQISFEKQKQFISDAGHELKTPLTIISANADILQDEIGENKWLDYIRMQTERMRILVDEMMTLTKMEHSSATATAERFNLSSAVETMALPFESQAFEQQKKFEIDIQPELYFQGNPEQIRRMIGILIDNAFKYSAEHGAIRVSLKEEAGGRSVLEVYNTGKGVREDEKEKKSLNDSTAATVPVHGQRRLWIGAFDCKECCRCSQDENRSQQRAGTLDHIH